MANAGTGTNVLKIDSTGSISTTGLFMRCIVWSGAASGNVLQLDTASGGDRVIKLTADANHTAFVISFGGKTGQYIPSLYVTTIGGGECDIFLVSP